MATILELSRKDTARLLQSIAKDVGQALAKNPEDPTAKAVAESLAALNITPATACFGQQHTDKESGAFIDNCPVCKNVGWLLQSIKIK
jgi:hypothetical protein